MKRRIAFDPQLCLSADEFVEAWNMSEQSKDSSAMVHHDSSETFLGPEITTAIIAAAVAIPGSIIVNLVNELIRKKLSGAEPPKITINIINGPDRQPISVITQSEEESITPTLKR